MTAIRAVFSASVFNAVGKAAGWVTSIYLASAFYAERGADDLAIFLMIQSGALAGALLDLGASAAFLEHSASLSRDDSNLRAILKTCLKRLLRGILLGTIIITSGILIYSLIIGITQDAIPPLICLGCAIIITGCGQIVNIIQKIQALELNEYHVGLSNLLASTVATTLIVKIGLKHQSPPEFLALWYVVAFWTVQTLMIIQGIGYRRIKNLFSRDQYNLNKTKTSSLEKYGLKFSGISITALIGNTLDIILIGSILTTTDAAKYGIGYRIFIGIQAAQLSINQLWPIIASKWEDRSHAERTGILIKMYCISSVLAVVMASIATFLLLNLKWMPGMNDVTFSSTELTGLFIFSVSSGIGGLSAMFAYRTYLLSGLLKIQIVWCVAMLLSKFVAGSLFGLGGFIWASVIVNCLLFHLPIVSHINRKKPINETSTSLHNNYS